MRKQSKLRQLYFDQVIKLHYEKDYGEVRISRILPIGHSTIGRWIAIFAAEHPEKPVQMQKIKSSISHQPSDGTAEKSEIQSLEAEVARLKSQLNHERLRADAYDEMINVAESRFNIAIRKKAGAKR